MTSEEEVFWTLVQIFEVYLPLDQYPNLEGLTIDTKVCKAIIEEKLPKLCAHLDSLDFTIEMLLTKWFICLFTNYLPQQVELVIWDFLFLEGSSILFRSALTVFQLISNSLMKARDLFEVQEAINESISKIQVNVFVQKLLQTSQISSEKIAEMRTKQQIEIKQVVALYDTKEKPHSRLDLMTNFYLFSGLR
jgi:hypothetical protein